MHNRNTSNTETSLTNMSLINTGTTNTDITNMHAIDTRTANMSATTVCAAAKSDELAQRIRDLPPELYNSILDYTTLSFEDEVNMKKQTYKLPIGLQINRAIRAAAAYAYYKNTTFFMSDPCRA
ncbi:hypothetical protein CLAFUW4_11878 [Fulvia fulva]|uniref:Uncharacterized protein n=1 Tax=Passalora fulva TaxID=5499 RepID=A0A9Q8PF36_PASFU|nr:uncharacterized protein CLAFUR5_10920 [Fulvia fulva]KAK4618077.1 hypothetical protein CLAFUR4_11883 [Fulvia fulva]UJO21275.1 hypothetical protein CLAFUR5_10920 [Fulvia fulva]WPV18255.1 hypothetical protein CLAFUW4_11878 [Fulvia fulva]WPV32929.1 hypothetical protein CLAFUW7_11885 [Fulvia fulva]